MSDTEQKNRNKKMGTAAPAKPARASNLWKDATFMDRGDWVLAPAKPFRAGNIEHRLHPLSDSSGSLVLGCPNWG